MTKRANKDRRALIESSQIWQQDYDRKKHHSGGSLTKVIELYAGPGAGKSTSAALLFGFLKTMGYNAELVREYVKEWAWEGKVPKDLDQFYLFGKQLKKESMCYGKVDYIVTDSPVAMGIYYAQQYAPPDVYAGVRAAITGFYQATEKMDVQRHRVLLSRSKKYNPHGRFQNEQEARWIDTEMACLLGSLNWSYIGSGTKYSNLLRLLIDIGIPTNKIKTILDEFDLAVPL